MIVVLHDGRGGRLVAELVGEAAGQIECRVRLADRGRPPEPFTLWLPTPPWRVAAGGALESVPVQRGRPVPSIKW